jgi:predicted DNA-binding WGR domain protein
MKRYLEFTNASTAIFWQIEIDTEYLEISKALTITSGKVGTEGYEESHRFDSIEAVYEALEQRVNEKIKSGYVEPEPYIETERPVEESLSNWFERLKERLFSSYKAAILSRPKKDYSYIQLRWTGQGLALGLSTDSALEAHEYIEDGDWMHEEDVHVTEVYRELEDLPDSVYDEEDDCEYECEFERSEWPKTETDCYELEFFLIYVALGLTLLKLQKDKDTQAYLKAVKKHVIFSVNEELHIFKIKTVEAHVMQDVLEVLLENKDEQALVKMLWLKRDMAFLKHYFSERFKGKAV